jgi:hypothetical protein
VQTGVAAHGPDQKQGNVMNSNPNRGSSRKEKKMNARTQTTSLAVLIALALAMAARAAEPPVLAPLDKEPTLPFTIRIAETVEMPDLKPLYYSDYPSGLTVIEGDLWFIGKNGDGPPVKRMKGKSIEQLKDMPGGAAGTGKGLQRAPESNVMEDPANPAKGRCQRPYILGGIWYDPAGKRIYAPLHCEYFWNKGPIQRQIHLASSVDLGLTWTYEGPIFLYAETRRAGSSMPLEGRAADCPGAGTLLWDAGHGDHHLFTDEKTGYHYLFSNHYLRGREMLCSRHQVVRCAIADKMAPAKWRKFHNGKWDEPGVGGKGSYVNGYCVTYNTYLNKYLSFDWGGGVAACDDIEKQNWTPIFKLPNATWGYGDDKRRQMAWYVTNEDKTDGNRTGQIFYVYTGWGGTPLRHRIELGPGETRPDLGFIASGLAGWEAAPDGKAGQCPSAMPDVAYPGPPFLDSGDPIESRRTFFAQPDQVTYHGHWKDGVSDQTGSAVRCAFRAKEIYYRHWAGPSYGRVDVYLDGDRIKTIDCWSSKRHNKQFGSVKTGLDPARDHVLEIRVRGDKHPLSSGTAIRAGTFEYGVDYYRASECFSAVQGKNQWNYRQWKGGRYEDLTTYVDRLGWTGDGKCAIGSASQTPGAGEVARTWTAPHDGLVCLQGHVRGGDTVLWDPLIVYVNDEPKTEAAKAAAPAKPDPKAAVEARILKNGEVLWTSRAGGAAHDLRVAVKAGDMVAFATRRLDGEGRPEK